MDINTLGSIGEFVGAFAVVVSVIYLTTQIRQGNRGSQSLSHAHSTAMLSTFNGWIVSDETMARIYREGLLDLNALTVTEKMRLDQLLLHLLMAFKSVMEDYDRNLMDIETYLAWEGYLGAVLKMPGGAMYWAEMRDIFVPAVQGRLDKAIAVSKPMDQLLPSIWT